MQLRILIFGIATTIAIISAAKFFFGHKADANAAEKVTTSIADIDIMSNWSENSVKAANTMKDKYGEPTEKTASMMIWKNVFPWKRVIVYANEVKHDFPMPHSDVMETVIDYKVPTEKFSDLAKFDGSIVCSRTNGEMASCCEKEQMNFLALNLANDIILGNKKVNEAREYYAKAALANINGIKDKYMQRLHFEVAKASQGDMDNISPLIDQQQIRKMRSSVQEQK